MAVAQKISFQVPTPYKDDLRSIRMGLSELRMRVKAIKALKLARDDETGKKIII